MQHKNFPENMGSKAVHSYCYNVSRFYVILSCISTIVCGSIKAEELSLKLDRRLDLCLYCDLATSYPGHCQEQTTLSERTSCQNETISKRRHIAHGIVSAGFVSYLVYGYYVFWQDVEYQEFTISDWNDTHQRTYAGGADKFSHAFGGYFMTRTISQLYTWSGKSKKASTWLGFSLSQTFLLFGEIEDGFTLIYGFDPVDLTANIGGGLLGVLEELSPTFNECFDFRISYYPSDEFQKRTDFDNIAEDYSGQTFYFVAKLPQSNISSNLRWLRFLEGYIGFETRGYMPGYENSSENQIADSTSYYKQRNIVYGLSLNIREILDSILFKGDRERYKLIQTGTNYLLEFYQHPVKVGESNILTRYPYYYNE